jgi:trk system potassium uptake protein
MKQFLVVGLGQFGQNVANALMDEGDQVIAIDKNEDPVEAIKDNVTLAIQLDATNQISLRALNLESISAAIVAIGDSHEDSVMVTINLREIGVPEIIVRASTPIHGLILSKVGATRIVIPEIETGKQVAQDLLSENIIEQKRLFYAHSLAKINTAPVYWGKTIEETGIKEEFNLLIVGIEKNKIEIRDDGKSYNRSHIIGLPKSDTSISEGDKLLVIGQDADIKRLVIYISEVTI